MIDSLKDDKLETDDEIEARNNTVTAGSSTNIQRQFHRKNEKRKKANTDCETDADSGESEKEDVVMDEKEKPIKVSLFSYLCNSYQCEC
jgi:hypothetical protein